MRAAQSVIFTFVFTVAVCRAFTQDSGAFDYRERALDNGLRVITLEDFSCPIVSVQVWYHVGSKDENPERQGFAHMFEHMMFRGTDRLGPTGHFDYIHRVGGYNNGYTSFDQTVYLQTLPANQLELALWLEAERMTFLKIDQESFDTERSVVEEESRLALNEPYGTLLLDIPPVVFEGRPYRWTPLGMIAHLRAAPVSELRAFWTAYYVPNNATLIIAGAVGHDRAMALAERYFGWIPQAANPPRVAAAELPPGTRRAFTFRPEKAPAPVVALYYPTAPVNHADYAPLALLAHIAGSGHSSRVYRRLVAQDQIAVAAQGMSLFLERDGGFGIGALLLPLSTKSDAALAALLEEMTRLCEAPVSPRELEKARNNLLRDLVTERLMADSKAAALGQACVIEGDTARVNRRIDDIRRCTEADLLRVARTYLAPDKATEIRVAQNLFGTLFSGGIEETPVQAPTPELQPPPTGRPGVTRPTDWPETPPVTAALSYDPAPKAQSRVLGNDVRVIVVENHEVPYLSIELHLRGGAWTEAKPGAAAMTMSMLTRGSARFSEQQFADELETYAISMNGIAAMDSAAIYAGCLTEHAERAVDLMAEAMLRPAFPGEELAKLKQQVATELIVQAMEPGYIVAREYRRRLYGDHPYARTVRGEVADVAKLEPDDVRQWWADNARPDAAWLIFAGDIDMERAAALAEKAFGAWQAQGAKPETVLPPLPEPAPTHIYVVDMPATQAQIRIGQRGITRSHPGYFTAEVTSGYFGDAFGSRINRAVRVEKGLTYGAWGGYSAQRLAGEFGAGTFTNIDAVDEAIRTVLAEFERLRDVPPDDQELGDTKTFLTGSLAARRETPQQEAGDVWLLESEGLPPDYFQRMMDAVAATDAAACAALARATVDTGKLVIVVTGPAQRLQAGLERIAPVTVVAAPSLIPDVTSGAN